MKKYLVTGGTGFVGQEVIRQILENGDHVTAIGRKKPNAPVEFVQADLRDKSLIDNLKGQKFDYILHIASLPGDTGNPFEMVEVNVNGALLILELGRTLSIKQIVIASSISAYEWYPATKFSPPDYQPVDEEHPCRPRDMYSTTKRMQELLAITYYAQYQVPVTCLRLTAVIGPNGQGGGRGWREIAEQLRDGVAVKIPHFSETERCHYIDIRDVARMMIAAAQCEKASGQIFNCCGAKAVTGAEFAQTIHKFYPNIKAECGFPWSMAQGNEIEFSMKKAKDLMDFEPIYSLEDSILSLKQWIDSGGLREETGRADTYTAGRK